MQARSIGESGGVGGVPLFLAAAIFLKFTCIKMDYRGVAPSPLLVVGHIRNGRENEESKSEIKR